MLLQYTGVRGFFAPGWLLSFLSQAFYPSKALNVRLEPSDRFFCVAAKPHLSSIFSYASISHSLVEYNLDLSRPL